MPTDQDLTPDEHAEFAAAFNDEADESSGGDVGSSDEAAPAGNEPAAGGADPGQSGGGDPAAAESTVALHPEGEGQAAAPSDDELEKERQRLRSWEGRLKAKEAELSKKGPGAEPEDKLEAVANAAEQSGNTEMADAASAAAEAVEAGEMTPEQAMAQLKEDFGDEFVSMIRILAKTFAKQEIDPVAKKADDVIATLNSKEEREHFKAIASKHPDYNEIGKSQDFQKFIQGLPEADRAEAERIAKAGSADEVIALLDGYKERSKTAAPPPPPAQEKKPAPADTSSSEDAEAMEGVRSGGVRLPERPQPAEDDFAAAWEQF